MLDMLRRRPDPSPARAPEGCHGWCPVCESGGRERPCWYCAYEGPFLMNTMSLLHP